MIWNPSYRIRVVCSGLALSLAACGGGSSGGSAANPASLAFSQAKGAPTPAAQMLDISDSVGGSHAWNAEAVYQSGGGWLRIAGATSASGATLPASLAIAVSPAAAPGTWNATVRVTGNVVTSAGFMSTGGYQVDDGTGKLFVVSKDGGAPREGAHVGVRGTFKSAFTIGTETAAVLQETERVTK